MREDQEMMLKSLVAVAWADGRVDQSENEVIEALLAAFEADEAARKSIHDYAKSPRTLADIDLTELSASDRRQLLQHATIMTLVDGTQSEAEVKLLGELHQLLRIPHEEATDLMSATMSRAERLMQRKTV